MGRLINAIEKGIEQYKEEGKVAEFAVMNSCYEREYAIDSVIHFLNFQSHHSVKVLFDINAPTGKIFLIEKGYLREGVTYSKVNL